jgi:hypothetical protein
MILELIKGDKMCKCETMIDAWIKGDKMCEYKTMIDGVEIDGKRFDQENQNAQVDEVVCVRSKLISRESDLPMKTATYYTKAGRFIGEIVE